MTNRARGLLVAFTFSAAAWAGLAMIGNRIYDAYFAIDRQTTAAVKP
jgi:hypothetical protein